MACTIQFENQVWSVPQSHKFRVRLFKKRTFVCSTSNVGAILIVSLAIYEVNIVLLIYMDVTELRKIEQIMLHV